LITGRTIEPTDEIYHLTCADVRLPAVTFVHDGSACEPYNLRNLNAVEMYNSKSWYSDKKVVLLVREPRDIIVSYYYHVTERRKIYNGSIVDFAFDPYYGLPKICAFLNSWIHQRRVPKDFLLLRYEDLLVNSTQEISKLVKFLRFPFDHTLIEAACQRSSLDVMKCLERGLVHATERFGLGEAGTENSYKVRNGRVNEYLLEFDRDTIKELTDYLFIHLSPYFEYGEIAKS
jgi:hypothetical protein